MDETEKASDLLGNEAMQVSIISILEAKGGVSPTRELLSFRLGNALERGRCGVS